jgi:hypothetical protein
MAVIYSAPPCANSAATGEGFIINFSNIKNMDYGKQTKPGNAEQCIRNRSGV